MVGYPNFRVGAARDPVACRRAVGDRNRNPYRSGTSCALARASFRVAVGALGESQKPESASGEA